MQLSRRQNRRQVSQQVNLIKFTQGFDQVAYKVAFVNRCSHTCGEIRVDMFVSAGALHVLEQTMLDGTRDVCSYIIVCIYSSCAADCNQ